MKPRFNSHSFARRWPNTKKIALGGQVVSVLFSAQAVWAADDAKPSESSETETTEPAERPKMNLAVPPEEPAVQRSAYVHNGFYLRLGVGPSYMYTSIRNKELDRTTDAHAFAVSANALVGGSPSPGMALGGGALIDLAPSASFGPGKEFLFHATAGPFFDAFPNDRQGFHLGTLVGVSALSVNEEVGTLVGGGGAAWLGYDMWVAPEWSAGFNAQFGGSIHGGQDFAGAVFHATLMITILNH